MMSKVHTAEYLTFNRKKNSAGLHCRKTSTTFQTETSWVILLGQELVDGISKLEDITHRARNQPPKLKDISPRFCKTTLMELKLVQMVSIKKEGILMLIAIKETKSVATVKYSEYKSVINFDKIKL